MTTGYTVTVTAKSKLVLTKEAEAGFHAASHNYVPGHIVLAALASAWIRTNGVPDQKNQGRNEFIDIFHSPSIRFGPLLADDSYVVPVSSAEAKPGAGDGLNEADFAFDESFEHHLYTEGKGQIRNAPMTTTTRARLDADTDAAMPNRYTALDGHLFNNEAIAHRRSLDGGNTVLRGHVYGEHSWLDEIADNGGVLAWMGADKSSMGRVDLALKKLVDEPSPDAPSAAGDTIVLRLTSPAIFVDDAGRPQTEPTSRDLDRIFGEGNAIVSRSWARSDQFGGWHAASGLPRPQELVTVPGSTFKIELTGAAPDWHGKLRDVGLGLRTSEGFGFAEAVTTPWRKPEKSLDLTERESAASRSAKLVEEHGGLFLDRHQRRWLIGALREARHLGASGEELPEQNSKVVELLGAGMRERELNAAQRRAVARMTKRENPDGSYGEVDDAVLEALISRFDDANEREMETTS